jgi:hypothetical protein
MAKIRIYFEKAMPSTLFSWLFVTFAVNNGAWPGVAVCR